MKPIHFFLVGIVILAYNVILIKRDQELFGAYDTKCAEISNSHSRCHLSK